MGQHAVCSASRAKQWLACPPSVRLEEKFTESKSDYAAEGSFAHEVGETILNYINAGKSKKALNAALKKLEGNEFYSKELMDYSQGYADYVLEKLNTAKIKCSDAFLVIEQKLDFSEYVPEGFGTGDAVIIADGMMEIIDLKYGKGVPVSAEFNPQMMLYAIGALADYDVLYGINVVRMTIYQPRLDNISEFIMTVEELKKWGEEYVKPRAELAFKGIGEFKTGEHCRFCKAKATCKARAEDNIQVMKYDFLEPGLLSKNEIEDILSRVDELKSWADDIWEYAYGAALKGEKWHGFKLVEGRSNRKFSDEGKVVEILQLKGMKDEEIFNSKLKGITELEKALGKAFDVYFKDIVVKPQGKPVLVANTDKRPEINDITNDFKEEN
jgi:hypothetical protein